MAKTAGRDLNQFVGELAGAWQTYQRELRRLEDEKQKAKDDVVKALRLARSPERNVPWAQMEEACAGKPRQLLSQIIKGER